MFKKIVLGVAVAGYAMMGVAGASAETRPGVVTLAASASTPAPAKSNVRKKDELLGLPVIIFPLLTLGAVIGGVVAGTSGSPNNPGGPISSPQ